VDTVYRTVYEVHYSPLLFGFQVQFVTGIEIGLYLKAKNYLIMMQFGLKAKQQNGVRNTLLQIEFREVILWHIQELTGKIHQIQQHH
jgi:hypothetical protein